jgi:hypothetical protein
MEKAIRGWTMRILLIVLAAAALLPAAQASAKGRQVLLCLDENGHRHRALCQRGTEVGQDYVCSCQGATTAVTAPACKLGEHPPEGEAASEALVKSLKTGTLDNVSVNGHRMCAPTRHVAKP